MVEKRQNPPRDQLFGSLRLESSPDGGDFTTVNEAAFDSKRQGNRLGLQTVLSNRSTIILFIYFGIP